MIKLTSSDFAERGVLVLKSPFSVAKRGETNVNALIGASTKHKANPSFI